MHQILSNRKTIVMANVVRSFQFQSSIIEACGIKKNVYDQNLWLVTDDIFLAIPCPLPLRGFFSFFTWFSSAGHGNGSMHSVGFAGSRGVKWRYRRRLAACELSGGIEERQRLQQSQLSSLPPQNEERCPWISLRQKHSASAAG